MPVGAAYGSGVDVEFGVAVEDLDSRYDNDIVTVVIPEFVVHRWWEHLLHNQSALLLKGRLLFRKNTVVTSVPYQVDK